MSTKISTFFKGVTFGFMIGLLPITLAVVLGISFVGLSIIFGGGTETYWGIAGFLLSLPWSFLMTGQDGTTYWMMLGGMLINLLIISIGGGIANLFVNLFMGEHGDKSNKC